jgi:repressor LexA
MNQRPLTKRQKEILDFVEERQRIAGFPPTIKETAEHFGFRSVNAARQHLRLIEGKGLVRRLPGRSRALIIPQKQRSAKPPVVRIPIVGRIAAGQPIPADQSADAFVDFPANFFRGHNLFALRVQGTSMQGAGILDGDLAVMDAGADVKPGAIGAVLVGDEATLKFVHRSGRKLVLKAANPAFADIHISGPGGDHVRVMGSLVGVVRSI